MMSNDSNSNQGDEVKVLRTWEKPPGGVTERDGTVEEMNILFDRLPAELSNHLQRLFPENVLINLNEIYLQRGQNPEVIVADPVNDDGRSRRMEILNRACTKNEIDLFASFFEADHTTEGITSSKRKGIPKTLHRISLITHPMKNPEPVLGVAVRVGRAMQGLLETMTGGDQFLQNLALKRQSLLLIGKPGVGKTTALREIALILSNDPRLNVVVVDKTCEIAGDGEEPHPAIGKARWMPVGRSNLQHEIMREAVENQNPDVIIVDEISTVQEVEAARTIAQRGVQLVATVHGHTLPELINCRERGVLLGGCTTVTLSGREAERRYDKRKQVQKRGREPVFHAALELHSRNKWIYHETIKESVDSYLEGEPCDVQQLEPGRAVAVASIPGEGVFEYCTKCGLGGTCSDHLGGHCLDDAEYEQSVHAFPGVSSNGFSTSGSNVGNGFYQPPLTPSAVTSSSPVLLQARASQGSTPTQFASSQTASNHSQSNGFHFNSSSKRGAGKKQNSGRGKGKNWRAPRGSGRCYRCGNDGHYARNCTS